MEFLVFLTVLAMVVVLAYFLAASRRRAGFLEDQVAAHLRYINRVMGASAVNLDDAAAAIARAGQQPHDTNRETAAAKAGKPEPGGGEAVEAVPPPVSHNTGAIITAVGPLLLAAAAASLEKCRETRAFREMDNAFHAGRMVIDTARLVERIASGSAGREASEREIDLCFVEGGFDFALSFPQFLAAYFNASDDLGEMEQLATLMHAYVKMVAGRRGMEIVCPPPLTMVSRLDYRIVAEDLRRIRDIEAVSSTVRRALINIHADQSLVVDCTVPELRRNGKVIRRGQLVIYNHSSWV